jgi:hypothetical protein
MINNHVRKTSSTKRKRKTTLVGRLEHHINYTRPKLNSKRRKKKTTTTTLHRQPPGRLKDVKAKTPHHSRRRRFSTMDHIKLAYCRARLATIAGGKLPNQHESSCF